MPGIRGVRLGREPKNSERTRGLAVVTSRIQAAKMRLGGVGWREGAFPGVARLLEKKEAEVKAVRQGETTLEQLAAMSGEPWFKALFKPDETPRLTQYCQWFHQVRAPWLARKQVVENALAGELKPLGLQAAQKHFTPAEINAIRRHLEKR
ncbi:MAG: hypothetical protein AABW54_04400, partial [Candidatus Micrarchaeota archaeon]